MQSQQEVGRSPVFRSRIRCLDSKNQKPIKDRQNRLKEHQNHFRQGQKRSTHKIKFDVKWPELEVYDINVIVGDLNMHQLKTYLGVDFEFQANDLGVQHAGCSPRQVADWTRR